MIIYTIIGALWITLSDKVLTFFVSDPLKMIKISTYKGWFFVICTAVLLYILIDSSTNEIKKSKDELRVSEERYRLVINNTTDGMWEWDIAKDKIIYPLEWKRLLGYKDKDFAGNRTDIERFLHPDDVMEMRDSIWEYLNGKIPKFKLEIRVKTKIDEYVWAQIRGQAIWDNEGKPSGMIGTVTDITERKITEVALKNTMEENKKLLNEVIEYDRLKTEFFTNISHEFRTPLNVILSVVQVLSIHEKKGEDTVNIEKINRYMKNVRQNCFRLLKLINNIIDVNRIDSGFLKLQLRNEDIVRIINQIVSSVKEFVSVNQLKITFSSNVKQKVMAFDVDKVERLMLNLISNSIKFTKPGGEIFINVYDLGDLVNISVRDTGIGIEKDKLPIIFARFRQVNSTLVKDSEGSGIGLSLVKSLVEMHNGDIRVISEPGIGTEFIISFPAKILSDEENESMSGVAFELKNEGVERAEIEFSDIYIAEQSSTRN
ncbi:PAS domain-containing sensor histidine kinase [Acetivibrio cellulolyticus]